MALLSTGNSIPAEEQDDGRNQQLGRRCQGGSVTGAATDPYELLDSFTFGSSEGGVSLEEGLNLLDAPDYSCFGNVSPQYSPFSEYSTGAESGYGGSSVTSPFSDSQRFVENLMNGVADDSLSKLSVDKLGKVQLDKNKKNAEAARQNRIKKKKYVEDLEKERYLLKTENVVLRTKCREFQTKANKLQAEVLYLKSVLANDSVLASLITNIPKVPEVKLTSSFRKRPNESEELSSCKKVKIAATKGGICLHVAKDIVSLELCQHCSKQAAQS